MGFRDMVDQVLPHLLKDEVIATLLMVMILLMLIRELDPSRLAAYLDKHEKLRKGEDPTKVGWLTAGLRNVGLGALAGDWVRGWAFATAIVVCAYFLGKGLSTSELSSSVASKSAAFRVLHKVPSYASSEQVASLISMHEVGSTVDRNILLRRWSAVMDSAFAAGQWNAVNAAKQGILIETATAHPEVADYNYFVESIDESLMVGGFNGDSSTSRRHFTLYARNDWRKDVRQGDFLLKIVSGVHWRSPEDFKAGLDVLYKLPGETDFNVLPSAFLGVERFETRASVVMEFTVTLALAEAIAHTGAEWDGRVEVVVVYASKSSKPFSLYFLEGRRYLGGVGQVRVTILTTDEEKLRDEDMRVEVVTVNESSSSVPEYVPVTVMATEHAGSGWEYSFAYDFRKIFPAPNFFFVYKKDFAADSP